MLAKLMGLFLPGILNAGRAGGASVTGAGGLPDRVNAPFFAAPVFFHSVRWYFYL